MEINIPFCGFYESALSQIVDFELESFVEHESEKQGSAEYYPEESFPEALHVDFGDFAFDCLDYRAAYDLIARYYVEAFDYRAAEALGISRKARVLSRDWGTKKTAKTWQKVDSLGLRFKDMTSPREYNFETDQIYCDISLATMRKLWAVSARDNHATFKRVIADRFTSRSGFISHYSARWQDWLKPLATYDHNELGALLVAALQCVWDNPNHLPTYDSAQEEAESDLMLGETYTYFDAAFDYAKFKEKVKVARLELWQSWLESDKDSAVAWLADNADEAASFGAESALGDDIAIPYRCDKTPDLFAPYMPKDKAP